MQITTALYSKKVIPFPKGSIEDTTYDIGVKGPQGFGNATSSGSTPHQVMMSNAFSALYRIITGMTQIRSVECVGTGYTYLEVKDEEGGNNTILINNKEIKGKEDISAYQLICALIADILAQKDKNEDCAEFATFVQGMASSVAEGSAVLADIALYVCDTFLYSCKNRYPQEKGLPTIEQGERLTKESLEQFNRIIKAVNEVDFYKVINNEIAFDDLKLESDDSSETIPTRPFIERCKEGEFKIPYEWDEESKKMIPDVSFLDLYIPSEDFEDCVTMMHRSLIKILENVDMGKTGAEAIDNYGKCYSFIGKPGTGKSTTTKAVAATLGIPYYPCTTTRYSEEDEYQGKTKLSHEDGNTTAAFQFCETPFLKAFQKGGLVVLEEFNLADPGMLMGAIGQAIEKPFVLERDGYEQITRHPMSIICFTCNVGTQGSQMPSEALFSRTPHVFEVDDPSENEFIKVLAKQTEVEDKKVIKAVFSKYKSILDFLKSENMPELTKVLTLRHCLAALDEISCGCSFKNAVVRCLINPFKVYAPEVAEDMKTAFVNE